MPSCDNCGSWVSGTYYRHWAVEGSLLCCPHCPDRTRRNGKVDYARSQRNHENKTASGYTVPEAGGDD